MLALQVQFSVTDISWFMSGGPSVYPASTVVIHVAQQLTARKRIHFLYDWFSCVLPHAYPCYVWLLFLSVKFSSCAILWNEALWKWSFRTDFELLITYSTALYSSTMWGGLRDGTISGSHIKFSPRTATMPRYIINQCIVCLIFEGLDRNLCHRLNCTAMRKC